MAAFQFVSTVQSASLHHADVARFLEDAKAKFAATMMILSSEILISPSVLTLACDFGAGWTATATSTCDPTMLQQRFHIGLGPKYIDRQVLELMSFVQEKFQDLGQEDLRAARCDGDGYEPGGSCTQTPDTPGQAPAVCRARPVSR